MKYIFGDQSLIKEIEIYRPSDTSLEAIIFVPDGADINKIAQLKKDIEKNNGLKVFAGEIDGKAVFRVSDFNSATDLLSALADDKVITSDFHTQETAFDEHQKIRDSSKLALLGAGVSFTVASSAILAAGAMRQSVGETLQGVMGIVPAIGLMWSSQQKPEEQMAYLYRDLRKFVEENDFNIGTDVRAVLADREAPNDLFHVAQQFVYEQGPVFNNWVKAMAVTAGTGGAIEQKNWWKAAGNAIMVGGMVLGATLPEKHETEHASPNLGNELNAEGKPLDKISEPPSPKKGFVEETIDGLTSNPQRIAGGFALIQQALKFAGNKLHDDKEKEKFAEAYPILQNKYTTGRDEAIKDAARVGKDDKSYQFYTGKISEFDHKLEKLEEKNLKNERYAKAVVADQISMAGYGVGYALYTMTKKHNGGKLELEPVIEICANIAHDHPQAQQRAVTERLSTFIANHKYSSLTIDEAVEKINYKLEALNRAEWLSKAENNAVPFERKLPSTVVGTEQQSIDKMKEGQELARVH